MDSFYYNDYLLSIREDSPGTYDLTIYDPAGVKLEQVYNFRGTTIWNCGAIEEAEEAIDWHIAYQAEEREKLLLANIFLN